MQHILTLFNLFLHITHKLEPAMLLVVRFGVAYIFLSSGLTKVDDFLNNDFASTKLLFQYEYAVPLLPPVLAAYLAMVAEIVCPILLIVGLASRLVAVELLVMTAVIQSIYPNLQHAWWAIMIGVVLFVGPGQYSLDHRIAKKYKKDTSGDATPAP